MRRDVSERTAIITGGSGGIGSAIARNLAADGVRVCLLGRNMNRLARVAASVARTASARPAAYPVDMASEASIRDFATRLATTINRLDILVFGHGNYSRARLEESSSGDFDRLYAANVRGPFLLAQLLLPRLRESKGQIVFINSTLGLKGTENVSQYAATQHALKGLADTLRNEVNPSGIRVLSVFCGRTATPLQERIFAMEGREYAPELLSQPEDIALAVSVALKLGPSSEITDIRIRPMQPVSPPKRNPEKAYAEPDLAEVFKMHSISVMQQISVMLPASALI
jgi:NAD(P)-dependent dehydrogenase (short-subunit alcohol dehydrogenase family)